VLDRIDREGEAVVLVGRRVVRLSVLAVGLLDACPDWTEQSELTDTALLLFGSPPEGLDPHRATVTALLALRDQGLVELD
jgi:hypothetical protein